MRPEASREPDITADLALPKDRGESPAEMEPLLVGETSRFRGSLTDLAVELAQRAAGFRRSLPESLLKSLADLVRSMNCYYSNLIEGHYTHPIDIERALKNDYSKDARKRDLQLEAKAHVAVQKWIDEGGLNYLLCRFAFGDITADEAIQSVELFARHVQPAIIDAREDA